MNVAALFVESFTSGGVEQVTLGISLETRIPHQAVEHFWHVDTMALALG